MVVSNVVLAGNVCIALLWKHDVISLYAVVYGEQFIHCHLHRRDGVFEIMLLANSGIAAF